MGRPLNEEQLLIWKDRVSRQRSSGLSIAEFCQQESISATSFYKWKRKFNSAGRRTKRQGKPTDADDPVSRPATFVRVPLPQPRTASWIEIVTADGTQVRLPHENLNALQLVLATLAAGHQPSH